jgi:cytochrome c5
LNGSETKLLDGFTFVLGIFLGALCATGAAVSARFLDHSEPHVAAEAHDTLALAERLEPVGQVVLLGDEALAALAPPPAAAPATPAAPLTGPEVFNQACFTCHAPSSVIPGAPLLGDAAAWAPRVAQGLAVLQEHALNGFQGNSAVPMPAKGGRVDLSDDEVRAAVEYMVSQLPQ